MTISLYSGTPGSGKSLHAARMIFNALNYRKIPVFGNFEINSNTKGSEGYTYIPNELLCPELLKRVANRIWSRRKFSEDSILLVIDECQLLFNSREGLCKDDKALRMEWISFFSQHRKFGYQIICIAQFDRMVDRQIRSLFEYEYIHRKMSQLGWKGRIVTFFTFGELYAQIKTYYPLKERLSTEFFRGHKKLYALYDSYGTFARQLGTDSSVGDGGTGAPSPAEPAPPAHEPALFSSMARPFFIPPENPSFCSAT